MTRLVLVALAAATLACTSHQGWIAVAATQPLDLVEGRPDPELQLVRRDAVGRDWRVTSVLLFPTQDGPRLERAVERALLGTGSHLMTNVEVQTTDFWFLVGVSVLTVRGNAVDRVEGSAP